MLSDKIWFTYKSRIRAHERLTSNDLHSQHLLIWYALISAVLSIAILRYPKLLGENTDIFTATMSVALLVISLLVANRDFRGRGIEMRRNYLALQRLYRECIAPGGPTRSLSDIDDDYQELLAEGENHTTRDDKHFRVFQDGLTSRIPSCREKAEVFGYLFVRYTLLFVLYAIPVTPPLFLTKLF